MAATMTPQSHRLASGSTAGPSGRRPALSGGWRLLQPAACLAHSSTRRQPAHARGATRSSAVHKPQSAALVASLAAALLLAGSNGAQAAARTPPLLHIRTEMLLKQQMPPDAADTGGDTGFNPGPIIKQRQTAPFAAARGTKGGSTTASVAAQAADALQRLEAARADSDAGRHQEALAGFTEIVNRYSDLALSEYARMGRALQLYQVGEASQALLELEDEEVAMKGQAEVHAALAAVLYAERPAQRLRAEQQWDAAQAFDTRYSDAAWVRQAKHWPPRMLQALDCFLKLQ